MVQGRSPSKWSVTTTPGVGEVTAIPVTENSSSAGVTAITASLFASTNQMGKNNVVCYTIFVIKIYVYKYKVFFFFFSNCLLDNQNFFLLPVLYLILPNH